MSTTRVLIRNSVFRNVQFLFTMAVTFVMTPFIVKTLGDRYYGFWTLVGTFMGYYGLLDLGLSSAVSRYISRAIGKQDVPAMSSIASTSFGLFSGISGLALLVTLAVSASAPLIIENQSEIALFRKIILLMGVTVAAGFPFRVFNGVLASHLRHDNLAVISIVRTLGANALIYFLLSRGGGILTLVLVNSGASLFEYLATYAVCRIQYPDVAISLRKFDRASTGPLFAYSGKTILIQIADLLRFRVDALVIAAYLNVSLVTYYSIGSRLIDYFGAFMVSTIGFVSPLFSKYEGQGDFTALRNRFLDVTRICTTISVFIGASIVFYGRAFMERWMGPGFESSYYITVILGIPATIALTQSPGLQLLYGLSKHHYYAVSNTLEGLLNLALSVFLVQHYGMYGVALGTAGEMFLFKIFIQPVLICRAAGLRAGDYLVKTIFLTAAKSLAPLLAYFYLMSGYIRPDYLNIFSIVCIQSLLFLPLLYFAVLNKDMKQRIRVALRLR